MSLKRHASHYLLIGSIQWLVDWGVLVLLSHWGLRVATANICGRISGALLGYWLNGKVTFAGDDTKVGRKQLLRFVLMWVATTIASSWLLTHINGQFGLKWTWLAKPAVELALGVIGFFLSRHWIYKH